MPKQKPLKEEKLTEKSKWPVIQNFSTNINELVSNRIHDESFKIIGREIELDRIIKNLYREDGTNLLITGPPGSGKRTLIHGLCQRIIDKQVPKKLLNYQFEYLDASGLVAGTKYRGQFEERIKAVTNELDKNEDLILIFNNLKIVTNSRANEYSWEMNMLGESKRLIIIANSSDLKNLTDQENDILSDFVTINVSPPAEAEIFEILERRQAHFEAYYHCKITDVEIYKEIIGISDVFLPQKSQPKKSIDLLEELNSDANISRTQIKNDQTHESNNAIISRNKRLKEIRIELEKTEIDNDKYGHLLQEGDKIKKERDSLYDQLEYLKKKEKFIISTEYLNLFCAQKFNKTVKDIKKRIRPNFTLQESKFDSVLPKFETYQASSILNGDEITIKRGTGFVLIPHNEKFDEIFETIIKPSLLENGLTAIKASDIYQPGSILNQVWKQIRSAEVIIADVSGQNSNVIFELGLCFAIKRSPILITQNADELPFNLRSLRYIEYSDTAKGGKELARKLAQAISGFLDSVRISLS